MRRPASNKTRALELVLLLAALTPGGWVIARAWKAELHLDDVLSAREQARRRVVARIPTDASVLINVTQRDMPATPDILNLGKRSTAALERCLSDNVDPSIRASCANMLGILGDRRALPTLRVALEDWEPYVRRQVIGALRRIPDPDSFAPLARLYGRKDEEVGNRWAILAALGELSSPKAVQLLRKEAQRKPEKKEEPDMRPAAFSAMWQSRHLFARGTLTADLIQALRSDNHRLARLATEAAAELRAPALVRHLIPLMEHPDVEVRNKAVYALGRIGDRTATKALLAHLPRAREARMLNNIAFALERLDHQAFYTAMRQVIEHKQAIIRLNAAFVVGDVKRPEGLPLLEKALGDDSDYVKTSAIVAVGKLGRTEGVPLLERFVSHENLSIQQEAIYALNQLTGGKRTELIYGKLLTSKKLAVRRRAAIELGRLGQRQMEPQLLACYERYNCALDDVKPLLAQATSESRTPGRLLLAWARGRTELTELVAQLKPRGTVDVAASVMGAAVIGRNPWQAARAVDLIGDLGGTQYQEHLRAGRLKRRLWLRAHSLVALVRLGDGRAAAELLAELDNFPTEWLPALAKVVARIEEAGPRQRLLGELVRRERSPDASIALAAAAVHLRWEPEKAFFRFLDALASPSCRERDLAERYLLRETSDTVTWLMRRAFAREGRAYTRDRLRKLLDARKSS